MKTTSRLIGFILILITSVNAQEQVPLPMNMAALGDSISEGMLSDFSIETPPSLWQIVAMVNLAREFSGADRLNAFRKEYAKTEHSWSAGGNESDLVTSHLERLQAVRPSIRGFNFAVSGSRSVDLSSQVAAFLDVEKKENILIDYVTVLLGANDVASDTMDGMVMPIVFEKNIEEGMRRLLDVNTHRMILLVGLPQILDVFEKSEKLVAFSAFGKDYKCGDMRQSVYGKAVLFDPKGPYYNAAKMVLILYQEALNNVAKRLRADYPAAHVKAIHDYDIPSLAMKTLSTDCFHPSVWGQALLSELTWAYGFWPDLVSDDMILGR